MSAEAAIADWIAVDWGTSHVRAWAMAGMTPVAEAVSDKGMGRLSPGEFEPALLELAGPWLGANRTRVVACGMVGARQGWAEAPYATLPAAPAAFAPVPAPAADPRLDVLILPGLAQQEPADVMRGEETQIAGYLAGDPGFDGVLCLPGTHTKWVRISAGEVVGFHTFMTGELFALLSRQSVLRHSVGDGWDDAAFLDAVRDAMARPEALAGRLFGIRAKSLLRGQDGGGAAARLSGLLIGAELAAARAYWLGQRIVLIGESRLSAHYAAALAAEAVATRTADARAATLAGLVAAHSRLKEHVRE